MSWLSDFLSPPAAGIPLPQAQPFTPNYPQPFGYQAPPNVSAFSPTGLPGAEAGLLGGIGGLSNYNLWNIPAAEATTASTTTPMRVVFRVVRERRRGSAPRRRWGHSVPAETS
jgi:hypothetical protein